MGHLHHWPANIKKHWPENVVGINQGERGVGFVACDSAEGARRENVEERNANEYGSNDVEWPFFTHATNVGRFVHESSD